MYLIDIEPILKPPLPDSSEKLMDAILSAPKVDANSIRPHSSWEIISRGKNNPTIKCRRCRSEVISSYLNIYGIEMYDYCPICGARMDRKVSDK